MVLITRYLFSDTKIYSLLDKILIPIFFPCFQDLLSYHLVFIVLVTSKEKFVRKMSSSFKRTQQRLDARRKKMNKLVKGIEEHEQERDDALHSRTKFTDPKYKTSASSFSFRGSSRGSSGSDTSMTSSNLTADDGISNIFEITKPENDKEKSKKKGVSPGLKGKGMTASPGPKLTNRKTSIGHLASKSKTTASAKDTKFNKTGGRGDPMTKTGAKGSKRQFSSKTSSDSRFSNSDR